MLSQDEISPGRLLRWRHDVPWLSLIAGRVFLVVEKFARFRYSGCEVPASEVPATRILIEGSLVWYYDQEICSHAEVVDDIP